jgi:hypothetical protein
MILPIIYLKLIQGTFMLRFWIQKNNRTFNLYYVKKKNNNLQKLFNTSNLQKH